MPAKRILAICVSLTLLAVLVGCARFNEPPTALVTATPTTCPSPLVVALDASGSSDPDGSVIVGNGDFGDGEYGAGNSVTHALMSSLSGLWFASS